MMAHYSSAYNTNRTKHELICAYLDLAMDRDPASIHVKDVIGRADYSRSAFYLHFSNIAALEEYMVSNQMKAAGEMLLKLLLAEGDIRKQTISDVCKSVYENRSFYTVILRSEKRGFNVQYMTEVLRKHVLDTIPQQLMRKRDFSLEIYILCGGFISFAEYWSENDFVLNPCDLEEKFYKLVPLL